MTAQAQVPPATLTPERIVRSLVRLLNVSPISENIFRGHRLPGGIGRVYGGQVIAQALAAAMRTEHSGKIVHSLHAYFMRPGDEDQPIHYKVEADFDGRSFANRRVVAMQHGKPILSLTASFQRREEGLSHQAAMPDVPQPEDLKDHADHLKGHMNEVSTPIHRLHLRPNPFEIRTVGKPWVLRTEPQEPTLHTWFRTRAPVIGDQNMHRTILAYATDFSLLATSMLPHGRRLDGQMMQSASLDHALWFHGDVKVDDWLLYTTDSPWSGHARGFNRGMIFDRNGVLVASSTQEGLIRVRK